MNPCIRLPLSLSDANAILTCIAGSDWRTPFIYGLVTVLVIGGLLWLAAIVLRARL